MQSLEFQKLHCNTLFCLNCEEIDLEKKSVYCIKYFIIYLIRQVPYENMDMKVISAFVQDGGRIFSIRSLWHIRVND